MRNTYIISAALLITAFLMPHYAFAGAWTTPKDVIWMEFYNKYWFANDYYGDHGKRRPLGWDEATNRDKMAESWAYDFEWKTEYGLADWMNLLFGISYESATYKERNRPASWGPYTIKSDGVKTVTIGGKLRAAQEPLVVSYQIQGVIAANGASKQEPSLGKNDDQLDLRVLLGKSFKLGRLPSYAGFETGYRFRGGDEVADDIPIFAEIGVTLLDWLMVTAEFDNKIGIGSSKDSESIGIVRGGIIFSPSGKFNQFKRENSFLNIAVQGGAVVWGMNTNASWEVLIKVSSAFDIPKFTSNLDTKKHKNTREVTSPTKSNR